MTPAPPTGTPMEAAGAEGGVATEGVAFSEPFFVDFPNGESGTVFFSGTGFCGVSTTTGGAGFSIFATGSLIAGAGAAAAATRATGARRISIARGDSIFA